MLKNRECLRLYAVTNESGDDSRPLTERVEMAIKGGATLVQLREKHLEGPELEALARQVLEVCRRMGVPFILNDDPVLAAKTGADGVHVGASDMSVKEARRIMGPDRTVGATAKTLEAARAAEAAGADYLGCGAVFGSTTKNTTAMSLETLKEITAGVSIPVVAIGGISLENVRKLSGTGIAGAAVVSGIFGQQDIEAAAARLKAELEAFQEDIYENSINHSRF